MQYSDLRDADITQAYFEGADLTKASFGRSNVKGTSFVRADICGANFEGVKNLTREQIHSAIICDDTILPEYLKTPWMDLKE